MSKSMSFRLPGQGSRRRPSGGAKGSRPVKTAKQVKVSGPKDDATKVERKAAPAGGASAAAARQSAADRMAAVAKPQQQRGLRRFLPADVFRDAVGGDTPTARVAKAFNAAQPVASRYALMGRQEELRTLVNAVVDQSRHAIIHGPRGSGKTSLARIFGDLADENGLLAVYNSASEELDFAQLMSLFVPHIPELGRMSLQDAAQGQGVPLTARWVAGLFVEKVRTPTFLIIDEFDRMEDGAAKLEVARLLKLLSDMRSNVRLIIVGIGRNVAELVAGHPSLRRALMALPVKPISDAAIDEILEEGASIARLGFSDNAKALLRFLAQGSPYHANLLSLHGALAALDEEARRVYRQHIERGGKVAFEEWEATNWDAGQFLRELAENEELREGFVLMGVLAARHHGVPPESFAAQARRLPRGKADPDYADKVLERMEPMLSRSAQDGVITFSDTLAPQFLLYAMTCGIAKAEDGVIEPAALDGFREVQAVKP